MDCDESQEFSVSEALLPLVWKYVYLKLGLFFMFSFLVSLSGLSHAQVNTVLQFGTLWLGLTNSVYLVPGDAAFSALW